MSTPKPSPKPPAKPAHEKSHLESKKFVAWFLSEMSWKVILIAALFFWKDDPSQVSSGAWWLLMAIVVTAGFIGIGFILGQAALDKYVRVAEIAADKIQDKLPGGKGADTPEPEPEPEPTDPKVNP